MLNRPAFQLDYLYEAIGSDEHVTNDIGFESSGQIEPWYTVHNLRSINYLSVLFAKSKYLQIFTNYSIQLKRKKNMLHLHTSSSIRNIKCVNFLSQRFCVLPRNIIKKSVCTRPKFCGGKLVCKYLSFGY